MRCIFCNKPVLRWYKICPYCGKSLVHSEADDRREVVERWKKMNSQFDYSKENIAKISALNDLLTEKSKKLISNLYEDVQPLLLKFQNEGFDDYYEFKIKATLYFYSEKPTPYADTEILDKLDMMTSWRHSPEYAINIDYNDCIAYNMSYLYKEMLKPIPHTGVFANHAFDKIQLCPAMDVIFNQQRGYTLFDALFIEEKDIHIRFDIDTAKHLWKKDPKIWNKKYFFCPDCHKPVIPWYKYCPRCFWHKMAKVELKNSCEKYRFHKSDNPWHGFDWNYENKMKVYALNDHITGLFDHIYDEGFRLKKVFEELKNQGKTEFTSYEITGYIKYLNRNPTPRLNKKWARIMNEATNTDHALHDAVCIDKKSEWNEDDRLYNNYIGGKDHLNWNIECFDRSFVGEHLINYYMHSLFEDGHTYSIKDIPYMNPEDWVAQLDITLCDDAAW